MHNKKNTYFIILHSLLSLKKYFIFSFFFSLSSCSSSFLHFPHLLSSSSTARPISQPSSDPPPVPTHLADLPTHSANKPTTPSIFILHLVTGIPREIRSQSSEQKTESRISVRFSIWQILRNDKSMEAMQKDRKLSWSNLLNKQSSSDHKRGPSLCCIFEQKLMHTCYLMEWKLPDGQNERRL